VKSRRRENENPSSGRLRLLSLADRQNVQYLAVVTVELDVSLAHGPDGANAREFELPTDVIASERQQGFAGRRGARQPQLLERSANEISDSLRSYFHRTMTIYREKRWLELLTLALDRVYVLRGQIVHGAATRGSSLNPAVLSRCHQVLEGLLPAILHLAIEHGANDDWPPLSYPTVYEHEPKRRRLPRTIRPR
jgi:hypothetical protein